MISIIAAVASNRVIGNAGKPPWHIPEDLKRFKALTSSHCVVMGRRTAESLPLSLTGRTNIVVSRNQSWGREGFIKYASLDTAIEVALEYEAAKPIPDVFVIGGSEIYAQTIDMADQLHLTNINRDYDGDAHFPFLDHRDWGVVSTEEHDGEPPFTFVRLERIRARGGR